MSKEKSPINTSRIAIGNGRTLEKGKAMLNLEWACDLSNYGERSKENTEVLWQMETSYEEH
jgi:hypothetical protein